MAANKELIKQAGKIQSHTISCPSSISQRAAVKALTGDDSYLENWVETYKKRRDLLLGLVGEIEGIEPFCPSGAFYLFCDISQWIGKTSQNGFKIDSCLDAAEFLLNEALVALVPGGAFGAPGHIRFSFACSEDNIVKGCARIKQAIEGLR